MFTKELAASILKIIDEKEMTLESLSSTAGLSRKFVGNIASGKQVPTLNSLEKICSALEVEPNDLLISNKSKQDGKSTPMCVNTVYCKGDGNIYSFVPVCPCCNSLLNNDWQSYCDNCGQRLSWERYTYAEITFEKPKIKRSQE